MALRPRRVRRTPSPWRRPSTAVYGTNECKFWEFHLNNRHVYRQLVEMCWEYRQRGYTGKIGICMLYEVLRWSHLMTNRGDESFKLSNNFKPHYARLIMRCNPDLGEIFEIRTIWSP